MSINVFLRQFEGQNFPYGRLKDRLAKIYHTGVRRLAQRRLKQDISTTIKPLYQQTKAVPTGLFKINHANDVRMEIQKNHQKRGEPMINYRLCLMLLLFVN
jgi:type II secretory pathway component PulK